ncbi:MAG: hypothetical protein CME26_00400 [Gemmatimonadetes bacterium]|nr:hypothetical protein [Gemmatimonadota bacterium]|tara:strand:- start:10229 stop:12232 length:2004 start_codon:yes stop_codon:yes gene_type:complete
MPSQAETFPNHESTRSTLTVRGVVLGVATGVLLNLYSNYAGLIIGGASLVKSQLPMAMLLPFVAWLLINTIVRLIAPRLALSGGELIVIYSLSWIVGTMSASGWLAYWGGIVSSPVYYASAENRWQEVLFDVIPWWCYPTDSREVIVAFYEGLPEGASIPWSGWLSPLYWWFSFSVALVIAGLCLSVIFQRQWEDAERLTFPLSTFAVALTKGFDGKERIPPIFKDRAFQAGFLVVFLVLAWNIGGFFTQELPRITIYDTVESKGLPVGRMFPPVYLRIMPPVIGLTYLCNSDLLLSFWLFRLVAILKEGVMARLGVPIGYSSATNATIGQPKSELIMLESHGAMVFLAVWSVWIARHHLKHVWQVARTGVRGPGDDGVMPYRVALLGFSIVTVYLLGCFMSMGLTPWMAICQLGLIYIAYFTLAKFTAATGFAYLFPVAEKGGNVVLALGGTRGMSAREIVGMGTINSYAFFGRARIPAWPALPHYLQLFGTDRRRYWTPWSAILVFSATFMGSCLLIICLGYEHAGQNLGLSGFVKANRETYHRMVSAVIDTDRAGFNPGKTMVWLAGVGGAWLLMVLYNRIPWWPLHPLGLAFQDSNGSEYYAFSMLLTWVAKGLIMRIGGIGMFNRARPFFFGLVVGYVAGIGTGTLVDLLFFPDGGHRIHGW